MRARDDACRATLGFGRLRRFAVRRRLARCLTLLFMLRVAALVLLPLLLLLFCFTAAAAAEVLVAVLVGAVGRSGLRRKRW